MAPLRGWAPRGEHLPFGHWNTLTFLAAPRRDRVEAPWLLDGPINGERFLTYVGKVLAPGLLKGDLVIMDNLGAQGQGDAPGHPPDRCQAALPAQILTRPQPNRAALRQAQTPRGPRQCLPKRR